MEIRELELHQVLAQSCLWAKNYSCAQEQFRQLLQQNPDSAAAHMLLGQALDGLQRTHEAIAEFEAAAKVAPREEPNVHFGLGYLHWRLRQYDEAKAEFEQELAIDPNHAQALAYLGDVEMKRNNSEKALALLRKAIRLKSDIRIAYLDMGAILAEQNHHQEAITAFLQAEKMDPPDPTPTFGWDASTRSRGTLPRRRRSLPSFASCTRRPMKTWPPRCQALRLRRLSKVSLFLQHGCYSKTGVGTVTPGCPVERKSTAFARKKEGAFAPPDGRGRIVPTWLFSNWKHAEHPENIPDCSKTIGAESWPSG